MSAQSPPHSPFSVEVVADDREVIVVLAGELDLASADEVAAQVRALRDAGLDRLVVDLRQVDFIDSCGLRLLIGLRNEAHRRGQRLTLMPGRAEVQRIFELTATRGLFDWRDY